MNRLMAIALGSCAALTFAAEISITASQKLPSENYVKNGNFNEGGKFWVSLTKDKAGLNFEEQQIKIEGADEQKRGVYEALRPAKPIPANVPMLIRYRSKKTETDFERKPGSMAMNLHFTNGKSQYVPVAKPPVEDHDWTMLETYYTTPDEVKAANVYLTYYDQAGVQCYDDVEVYAGNLDLTVAVSGEDVSKVTLRHSITGTIFAEMVKAAPFSKTVKVPAFGSYCVEVQDKSGRVCSKLYPENVDSNVASSDNVVPLTAIKRVVLKPNTAADVFTLDIADLASAKNAELNLKARLQRASGFSGYANALKIYVNGKELTVKELLKPKNDFITAAGKSGQFSGNNGFVLYYAHVFCAMNDENTYCPSSLVDKNPFEYKFAIGKYLQAGLNKIEIKNSYRTNPKLNFDVWAEDIFVKLK